MMPLVSVFAITMIGALGAYAILTVSPNLTGVLTSATVFAVTLAMGRITAVHLMERPRPQHRKPGPIITWLDGEQE